MTRVIVVDANNVQLNATFVWDMSLLSSFSDVAQHAIQKCFEFQIGTTFFYISLLLIFYHGRPFLILFGHSLLEHMNNVMDT